MKSEIKIEIETKGNDIEVKIVGGASYCEIMAAAEAMYNLCNSLDAMESEEK